MKTKSIDELGDIIEEIFKKLGKKIKENRRPKNIKTQKIKRRK